MTSTPITTGAKKTVGPTTLSGAGGSAVGVALATIIMALLPVDNTPELFGAVAVVCSVIFTLAGGYLSPSKEAQIAPYLDVASNQFAGKVPSADEVAQRVAEVAPTAVVPSAEEIAEHVVKAKPVKAEEPAKPVEHEPKHAAKPEVAPEVEARREDYPDITSMAQA